MRGTFIIVINIANSLSSVIEDNQSRVNYSKSLNFCYREPVHLNQWWELFAVYQIKSTWLRSPRGLTAWFNLGMVKTNVHQFTYLTVSWYTPRSLNVCCLSIAFFSHSYVNGMRGTSHIYCTKPEYYLQGHSKTTSWTPVTAWVGICIRE